MALLLKPTKSGAGSVKAPPGNHLAVLVGIFEMGEQEDRFDDKKKPRPQVYLLWELTGEQISGTTKNHVIGTAVTKSLNEKATLRAWIKARTGKDIPEEGYNLANELGQPCMLNVVMDGDWPRIGGVAAVPKGFPAPKPTYPPTCVELEQFIAGATIPDWVPWHFGNPLADHIRACVEIGGPKPVRKAKKETAPVDGGEVIPF